MSILEKIHSPDDLKALPANYLPRLAEEIRVLIIETVKKNGGHMASNLGMVELTIALHRVLDSPHDRIIMDTSHQCYPHKILTGRSKNFSTIRTLGGLSGFFEPQESEHDLTVIGHAGTGPSLALGWATGEKLRGGHGYAVCVIGDGSLTAGVAYEGLSNIIAQNPQNLMVILNDNGMSISQNVGWLAQWRGRWLPELRSQLELEPDFLNLERLAESLAPKLPFGPLALGVGKVIKSSVQRAIIPQIGQFWEEMGFNYIGPIDGHDTGALIETLDRARQSSGRVPFIHVVTNKGNGFGPAEADPVTYHQPGSVPNGKTYSEVFSETLGHLMETDSRIVAISAAMLGGTGLAPLKTRFPDRIFDVGIAEQAAVAMAAGMARNGLRPVVCIYSTFLQRAFDQVLHDVCLNDLPVVFAVDRAGIVGQDGKTHHGMFDLAFMRIPPNMIVSVPRDENQLRHLLYTGLNSKHPFAIRYPRGAVQGVALDNELRILPFQAESVRYAGLEKNVCILAMGPLVQVAVQAAEELGKQGIMTEVVDLRFVKPMDANTIKQVYIEFDSVLVLEEASSVGGAYDVVLQSLDISGITGINAGDRFIEHGSAGELRRALGLDVEGVIKAVKQGGS